jgi:sporulation protein YhbH
MSLSDTLAGEHGNRWYDLFSRGTRDWLRHNEKIREAVQNALPDLIAHSDVLSRPDNRTVQVPVRFMEHYRFRLLNPQQQKGAGQGKVAPGDVLRQGQGRGDAGHGAGGNEDGGVSFVMEFKVDDILDWLWEELQLPNLKPRDTASLDDEDYVREGWDKKGARSRLDRRRTIKEAVKRRAVQGSSAVPIVNEDLRFRQLVKRQQPSTNAVVFFLLDVSSSMDDQCRKLAKTFFFWALQGIRRQFLKVETVFIAHTIEAWEFQEEEFFKVHGEGGTQSSTAFQKAAEIMAERYDPSRYNTYLFYASDGDNFMEDRHRARGVLESMSDRLNFLGYAEVSGRHHQRLNTEVGVLFRRLAEQGAPAGSYAISSEADIWPAIKAFFTEQADEAAS